MTLLEEIRQRAISPRNFIITNGDTDSIAFKKPDEKPFSDEERQQILNEINSLMPVKIRWEDDKHYRRFIVVKAKNYILDDGKSVKVKGSGLKATMKEPALKQFINDIIDLLLKDRKDHIFDLYNRYALTILKITDISEWCFKKTVTKSILNPERTTEQRVLDAIGNKEVNEGDKVYLFFKTKEEYCLREHFNGEYCQITLLGKLYDSLKIFSSLIDVSVFPDYSLKRNRKLIGLE